MKYKINDYIVNKNEPKDFGKILEIDEKSLSNEYYILWENFHYIYCSAKIIENDDHYILCKKRNSPLYKVIEKNRN